MNKNTNPRRSRGRNNSGRGGGRGNKRHQNRGGGKRGYRDGQLLDGRTRHNYQQNLDKFIGQAKDASSSGDPVAAENFYQHAEHYFRVLKADDELKNKKREERSKPNESTDENEDGTVEQMATGEEKAPEEVSEAVNEEAAPETPKEEKAEKKAESEEENEAEAIPA